MSKKVSLEKKILNSRFSYSKNFLYFLIVPILILIVGIVLISTIGFNLGVDFKGGVTFKVYANNEAIIEDDNVVQYDLTVKRAYDEFQNKIETVLNKNGLSVISYRQTSMSIYDYDVYAGQALEIVYQNNYENAEEINQKVRDEIISTFGYENYELAVSSFDDVLPNYSFDWVIGIVAAIVFALIVAIIYLSLRYNTSASVVALLNVAFDIFLTLGMIAICRLTVNMSIGIILLVTFFISIFNVLFYFTKVKENLKAGKYEKMKNSEMADLTVKELTMNKTIIYVFLLLISFFFAVIAVEGVREVALGIMISVLVTFYTSQCLLPSYWATIYKNKKKKHIK